MIRLTVLAGTGRRERDEAQLGTGAHYPCRERENGMAGTGCGFAQGWNMPRTHPTVQWAKLRALSAGVRLASERLWS
jgi:hypothetical protein